MIVRPLKSVWRFARNELSGKPGAVHQGHDAEQRFVIALAENDRRVAMVVQQADVAFGNVAFHPRAIRKDERHPTPRHEPNRAPHLFGQQAVFGTAVDQELHAA
jgi:hypothetical protein